MTKKRKPTAKEWQKIRIMYLKGVKPRFIVQKFPELDLSAKAISNRFSANSTKEKRDKIKERVEKTLLEDIATEQENANKEMIEASKKIIQVVKKYLDEEMYLDFAGFGKNGFNYKRAETINTRAFLEITKALCGVQKAQRVALNMDKELEEKQELPVININFGDDENEDD